MVKSGLQASDKAKLAWHVLKARDKLRDLRDRLVSGTLGSGAGSTAPAPTSAAAALTTAGPVAFAHSYLPRDRALLQPEYDT